MNTPDKHTELDTDMMPDLIQFRLTFKLKTDNDMTATYKSRLIARSFTCSLQNSNSISWGTLYNQKIDKTILSD